MNSNITKGSGNVFADIGVPDAETHLLKAELMQRIAALIESKQLTQVEAASRMGLTQPDVSKMLRGQFRPVSLERLMQCLVSLGQNIVIDVHAPPNRTEPASIKVS